MIFENVVREISRREDLEEQAANDARQAAWDLVRSAVIADLKDEPGPPVEDLIDALEVLGHEAPRLVDIRKAIDQVRLGGGLAGAANWAGEDIRVRAIENQRLKDDEYQAIVIRRQRLNQAKDGWRWLVRTFAFTDRMLAEYVTPETARLARKIGPPLTD